MDFVVRQGEFSLVAISDHPKARFVNIIPVRQLSDNKAMDENSRILCLHLPLGIIFVDNLGSFILDHRDA